MADYRLEPSQWETSSQCNAVCHWLGANLETTLHHISNQSGSTRSVSVSSAPSFGSFQPPRHSSTLTQAGVPREQTDAACCSQKWKCPSMQPSISPSVPWTPVASFTKEVNRPLAKCPLKPNGRLANRRLTSLVKEATGVRGSCTERYSRISRRSREKPDQRPSYSVVTLTSRILTGKTH